jgi:hypothetical protein
MLYLTALDLFAVVHHLTMELPPPPCTQGVQRFAEAMDKLMDSDDETMFTALMEEEAENATDNDEEHLMMLSCLMALYARNDAKPPRGGSALGCYNSKPMEGLEGYCILYTDYFDDDPLHGEVVFWHHFRMS